MTNSITIMIGVFLGVGILLMAIYMPNHLSNVFLYHQYDFDGNLAFYQESGKSLSEIKILKDDFAEYKTSFAGLVHRFIDLKSFFIVLGGSFSASLIAYKMGVALGGLKQLVRIFTRDLKDQDLELTYHQLIGVAKNKSENEPITDEKISAIKNEIIRTWVQDFIAINIVTEEVMKDAVDSSIEKFAYTQFNEISILKHYSKTLPAFGMTGTVIGLVLMLGAAADSGGNLLELMAAMAIALLTTLYGVVFSQLIFTPAMTRRTVSVEANIRLLEMGRAAIFEIFNKQIPEIVENNIISYLPMKVRARLMKSRSAAAQQSLEL